MKPDEIRQARINIFKTQAKAARHFKVTQSGWSKWERGARKMPEYFAASLQCHQKELERKNGERMELATKLITTSLG
jgi:DNA-binding transcriptional regulator YiaG